MYPWVPLSVITRLARNPVNDFSKSCPINHLRNSMPCASVPEFHSGELGVGLCHK